MQGLDGRDPVPDHARGRRALAEVEAHQPVARQDVVARKPFGGLDLGLDLADLGVDSGKLALALDEAFAEPGPERRVYTRAVVVVYKGHLIAERYAPAFNKDMPLLGWSMAKSITNALVGILVKQGKLDIYQPAPVPEWQADGDLRQKITLDQLLRMSSGLEFEEIYMPMRDVVEMLFGSYDFAKVAAAKPLEAEPDEKWNYSGGTTNIVARIVRQVIEPTHEYYYDFIYAALFDRIAM